MRLKLKLGIGNSTANCQLSTVNYQYMKKARP
jgi:hypothetical protein